MRRGACFFFNAGKNSFSGRKEHLGEFFCLLSVISRHFCTITPTSYHRREKLINIETLTNILMPLSFIVELEGPRQQDRFSLLLKKQKKQKQTFPDIYCLSIKCLFLVPRLEELHYQQLLNIEWCSHYVLYPWFR